MAAAVGGCCRVLDVDVDQVAGCGVFVAADGRPVAVQTGEAGEAVAGEDAVDGRRIEPEREGDPGGSPTSEHADLDDPALGPRQWLLRASMNDSETRSSVSNAA